MAQVNSRVQPTTATSSLAVENEDVHMQTMKNTINPAMLKQLSSIPSHVSGPIHGAPRSAVNPYAVNRGHVQEASEDVYMRTAARHDTKIEKERGLQLWEKELLEKAEVRRKATVAQICEWMGTARVYRC